MDPGTKSEGEEDSQHGTIKPKATLGKTPNHLTLRYEILYFCNSILFMILRGNFLLILCYRISVHYYIFNIQFTSI